MVAVPFGELTKDLSDKRKALIDKNKQTLVVALGLLVIFTAVSIGIGIVFPAPRFPTPTGTYGIGTRIYHWTDVKRSEPFTNDPNDRRELMVQVWYPTTASGFGSPLPYMSHPQIRNAIAAQFRIPAFLLTNIQKAPTHAFADAPAAEGVFPVLLNPTGFTGFRDASLFWIEELVSHGYVVIGLDQPGTAAATVFPDGRVVPAMRPKAAFDRYMPLALSRSYQQTPIMNEVSLPGGVVPFLAQDLRFALDQAETLNRKDKVLAGHLDTTRAGVFGMSLGGYIGPEACYQDARFRACVAVDAGQTAPVVDEGLRQPVMIISRDAEVMRQERDKAGGWPEPEIIHTINGQKALFERSQGDAFYLTMNTMFHINWTDAPLWTPLVKWIGLAGPIDPYRGFAATNAYTVAFFNRYLKNEPSHLLQAPSDTWPEVQFDHHLAQNP